VMSGFQNAVGRGERIVEDRIVGEVAHGKVVDLLNGTIKASSLRVNPLNREPPREHGFTLNDGLTPNRLRIGFI
jgi:hypothetical protein